MCPKGYSRRTKLNCHMEEVHGVKELHPNWRFQCPRCSEKKPFRTLTAMMAHCNECHQVEFGMNTIKYFSQLIVSIPIIGIQNHDFPSMKDFIIWKEQEEESTHTFYTLHDKPHKFSSCNSPNGDYKLH